MAPTERGRSVAGAWVGRGWGVGGAWVERGWSVVVQVVPGLLADRTEKNFHPGKKLFFAFLRWGWENKFLAGRKNFAHPGSGPGSGPSGQAPW